MAGGRTIKTAIVRSVVPQAYRDVAAGMQLYGKSLDTAARGFTSTADKMKSKAGDWMQGNRSAGEGNLSGVNSSRAPRQWPPQSVQSAEDIGGAVSRNVAAVTKIAEKSMMTTVMGDLAAAAPKALAVAARVAFPTAIMITAAGATTGAIGDGLEAYDKGGSALDVAKAAGFGAVNSALVGAPKAIQADIAQTGSIGAGLEKWAGDVGSATLKTFGFGMTRANGGPTGGGKGGKAQGAGFDKANANYAARMKAAASAQPGNQADGPKNTKRGFQNPANQTSAQAALGHSGYVPQGDDDS